MRNPSKKWAYYNEFDPKAAAWLRELMSKGLIMQGEVDERSITEVRPDDLKGFIRCGFFAGIGGWDLALQLAGWPQEQEVWHGSCPCQPFSSAGKGLGSSDERHLWPAFYALIKACRPPIVFGEQVASAAVIGKAGAKPNAQFEQVWLDGVFADLEEAHYACGAVDIPAAGICAPHIRQRLYWVAHTEMPRRQNHLVPKQKENSFGADDYSSTRSLAHTESGGFHVSGSPSGNTRHADKLCAAGGVGNPQHPERGTLHVYREDGPHGQDCKREEAHGESGASSEICDDPREEWNRRFGEETLRRLCGDDTDGMADVQLPGLEGHAGDGRNGGEPGRLRAVQTGSVAKGCPVSPVAYTESQRRVGNGREHSGSSKSFIGGEEGERSISKPEFEGLRPALATNFHSDFDILPCRDGKSRRVESGSFPLVNGLPKGMVPSGDPSLSEVQATAEARVMRLKGYGNAVVPALAAEFILASLEAILEPDGRPHVLTMDDF